MIALITISYLLIRLSDEMCKPVFERTRKVIIYRGTCPMRVIAFGLKKAGSCYSIHAVGPVTKSVSYGVFLDEL